MPRGQRELQRAGLKHHKRVGKELISPLNQLSPQAEQIFWMRDFLPEFLWIDSLVNEYSESEATRIFNQFLSLADVFNPHEKRILDGTVGAFRLIPQDRRDTFLRDHAAQVDAAVVRPFHGVLDLYAKCPMAWMLPNGYESERGSAMEQLRSAVMRLLPGKDPRTAFCRAFPLNRFFAHDKVFIARNLTETIEAIEQYPHGDRERAESFARNIHHTEIMQRAETDPNLFAWARLFWESNLTMVPCIYG